MSLSSILATHFWSGNIVLSLASFYFSTWLVWHVWLRKLSFLHVDSEIIISMFSSCFPASVSSLNQSFVFISAALIAFVLLEHYINANFQFVPFLWEFINLNIFKCLFFFPHTTHSGIRKYSVDLFLISWFSCSLRKLAWSP